MHAAWEQLTDALPTGRGGRLGQVDVEHISPDSLLGSGQGLTLVHFSAQPEPILTELHTLDTPLYSLTPPK
jgi:hypothetical protein